MGFEYKIVFEIIGKNLIVINYLQKLLLWIFNVNLKLMLFYFLCNYQIDFSRSITLLTFLGSDRDPIRSGLHCLK